MLGLYGCALLKEAGFSEIYCLGHQTNRHDLIKRFCAIPVNNGIYKYKINLVIFV